MAERRQEVHGEHDLIEIRDPEIDAVAIMDRIREGIEQKRRDGVPVDRQFPHFGVALVPEEPTGEHDVALYYYLQRLNEICSDIGVGLSLADSPYTTLPVVGPIWSRVRRQVHGLVLYYIGLLARKQVRVNTHIVSTVNRLVAGNARQAEEIADLRRQVAQLQQELRERP